MAATRGGVNMSVTCEKSTLIEESTRVYTESKTGESAHCNLTWENGSVYFEIYTCGLWDLWYFLKMLDVDNFRRRTLTLHGTQREGATSLAVDFDFNRAPVCGQGKEQEINPYTRNPPPVFLWTERTEDRLCVESVKQLHKRQGGSV